MTLPDERYRSLIKARDFLRELMDPSKTKRIPREIRRRAYYALKHFPGEYDLKEIAKALPKLFSDED